jgi:hypothetical protein
VPGRALRWRGMTRNHDRANVTCHRWVMVFRLPFFRSLTVLTLMVNLAFVVPGSLFALGVSTGDGAWNWQNPVPQGNDLHNVRFVDSQPSPVESARAQNLRRARLRRGHSAARTAPQIPRGTAALWRWCLGRASCAIDRVGMWLRSIGLVAIPRARCKPLRRCRTSGQVCWSALMYGWW